MQRVIDEHRLWFERMIVDFILILAAFSCARIRSFRIGKLNISFVCFWMLGSKSSSFEIPMSMLQSSLFLLKSLTSADSSLFIPLFCKSSLFDDTWSFLFTLFIHVSDLIQSSVTWLFYLFGASIFILAMFSWAFTIFFCRFMSTCSLQVTEKCDSRVSLVQTSFLGSVPLSDLFRKSSHQRSNNFSSLWI